MLPRFSLTRLAAELEWPEKTVKQLFIWFLALHDLGKFARAFQGLVADLSPDLVPKVVSKRYTQRHDTLGWLIWRDYLVSHFPEVSVPNPDGEFWADWVRTAVGHHGKPPQDTSAGGSMPLDADDFFTREDKQAVSDFTVDVAAFLLPRDISIPGEAQQKVLRRHVWYLAGLAVLADWLGSNQDYFHYRDSPQPLPQYWESTARPRARLAVEASGLAIQQASPWQGARTLFEHLREPSPLQHHACDVVLGDGPQMFLLEDVTGAGKTEAALILVHRLMAAGIANGLYFGLPSMATANQMYRRVGQAYRRFYRASATPSLVLAHGARQLVVDFRQSVLQLGEPRADRNYQADEASANAQCSAWLADNRKKALLADVGVGTLDQALLAALPARHQPLRLLGLAGKVLLVDEVHAYDKYMHTLLKGLLEAHAQQGGSAILLSATLPATMRADLVQAFQRGCGTLIQPVLADAHYPLVTQVHASNVVTQACATRAQLMRRVRVAPLHSEQAAAELIVHEASSGHCVCWIRNTIGDARRAWQMLGDALPPQQLLLFHSRFAMGDRLAIEDRVLADFGCDSTGTMRRGKVLVATQVVEQSLDLDFDILITDLAPVDLAIQRAGRLQRHVRDVGGSRSTDGVEHRPAPVLYLLCPESSEQPGADWYAALFPQGRFVYPNVGQLWLTQRALLRAGEIASPGACDEPGAVRRLVEAVYGEDTEPIPSALQKATIKEEGNALAEISQARFNLLGLNDGYRDVSSLHWNEDTRVPTRLGDENMTVYLAREECDVLKPLIDTQTFGWEYSAVKIHATRQKTLTPEWAQRFESMLAVLRQRNRLLEEPAFVLPVVREGDVWVGWWQEERSAPEQMMYDPVCGLRIREWSA